MRAVSKPLSARRLRALHALAAVLRDASEGGSALVAMLEALHARYPTESILLCSHGGPSALGYQGLTGRPSPVAGYTALYVMVPDADGKWSAPLAADTSHLEPRGQA